MCKFYLSPVQITRDKSFVMELWDGFCLFCFDENNVTNLDICILLKDGKLHWTKLDSPEIPKEYLINNNSETALAYIAELWQKNYDGTY